MSRVKHSDPSCKLSRVYHLIDLQYRSSIDDNKIQLKSQMNLSIDVYNDYIISASKICTFEVSER